MKSKLAIALIVLAPILSWADTVAQDGDTEGKSSDLVRCVDGECNKNLTTDRLTERTGESTLQVVGSLMDTKAPVPALDGVAR